MAGEAPEATVRLFSDDIKGAGRMRCVVECLLSCLEDLTQSLNLRKRKPVGIRDSDANIYPDEDSSLDVFPSAFFPTPLVVLGASEPPSSSAFIFKMTSINDTSPEDRRRSRRPPGRAEGLDCAACRGSMEVQMLITGREWNSSPDPDPSPSGRSRAHE